MNFNQYSAEAARVWLSDPQRTLVDAIGLCAEAGEAADHFKKQVGHDKPLSAMEVGAELGDALWYLDRLAARAGFTLEEIAVMNTAKLQTRYPDCFQDVCRLKDEKKEAVAMAIALRNHRERVRAAAEEVPRWRPALTAPGYDLAQGNLGE